MSSTKSYAGSKPRYATARRAERDTFGGKAQLVARALNLPLMPWQADVVDVFGETVDGHPAYRELVEPSQPTPKAIRQWAKATGLYVGTRGRIPADVELAYMQARQA